MKKKHNWIAVDKTHEVITSVNLREKMGFTPDQITRMAEAYKKFRESHDNDNYKALTQLIRNIVSTPNTTRLSN